MRLFSPETITVSGFSPAAIVIIFAVTLLLSVAVYYRVEPKIASLISFTHKSGKTVEK